MWICDSDSLSTSLNKKHLNISIFLDNYYIIFYDFSKVSSKDNVTITFKLSIKFNFFSHFLYPDFKFLFNMAMNDAIPYRNVII